jgi:hypothetical protein
MLNNMNIAPLCTFCIMRFVEQTAIILIKSINGLQNPDKLYAVWDTKLLLCLI